MIFQVHYGMLLLLVGMLLPGQVEPIVGGGPAQRGEFPHQALLGYPTYEPFIYDFNCGGSLISDRYVLTAAHCVYSKIPDIVRLGEHNLKDDNDGQVDVQIESITRHPEYSGRYSYHDIALVKLKKAVAISQWIQPACIWKGSYQNFTSVIATGYGVVHPEDTSTVDTLQKVQLDIFENHVCNQTYGNNRKFVKGVVDSQLCIGSDSEVKDTCQGDAGGPVQVSTGFDSCRYHVVGITSTGIGCGNIEYKSIYTRVASYADWIEETIKD